MPLRKLTYSLPKQPLSLGSLFDHERCLAEWNTLLQVKV